MTKRWEKEIYVIRHGETEYNRKGIIQGRGVNSTLNERGVRQAIAFHESFKQIQFDAVFTSSLIRTQQTVEPFVRSGHIMEAHEDLDEINWGVHEGRLTDTGLSREYLYITGQWRKGALELKIPGGESPLDLQQRQLRFIKEKLKPHHAERILLCSHGRAMRSLLCTLLDKDLSCMDDFPHQNLSLYKLNYADGIFQIDLFNYVEHVKDV